MAMPLLTQLQYWLQQAATHHIRLPVVWQGEQQTLRQQSQQLLKLSAPKRLYWLGADAPENAIDLSGKAVYQVLGGECDALVINAFNSFHADMVAAATGCVKAGGLWLLLCPPFDVWQQQPNPAHKSLLPYPLDASTHQGGFLPFWLTRLQQQNVILLGDQHVLQQLRWPAPPPHTVIEPPYLTAEQQQAVAAVCHVVSGHRRRPLVLTANRGRGKSAALGIAAAQLAKQGKSIVLTAPLPAAAETALYHFNQLAPQQRNQLQFVPFDALLRDNMTADLLLVDEAAAIPTPVLQLLLQRFSRIVFASTEHGYEGTGRGFQLRFQQYLNAQCPNWRKLHLQQPVRYQIEDPLEQLIFNCFLLQQPVFNAKYQPAKPLQFHCFTNTDWAEEQDLLQQVFSLLSLAHYQTQVKDLAALLDNPQLLVITVRQDNQLLACALVSVEGDIPPTLARQVYHAERRLQGHLLAQNLAFHLAQPELATKLLWRVMRIAVQPALQRQGLGKQLLQHVTALATQRGVDYLGTSFGATPALLQFWQHVGYQPVRLGTSNDKASAEYSVLMLNAISADKQDVDSLEQQFRQQLYHTLSQYPLLHSNLALTLALPPASARLTPAEREQLQLFGLGKRPYELISHLLLRWFNATMHQLPVNEQQLLCSLLWQHQSWADLVSQYQFVSKKALQLHLATLVQQCSKL